MMPLAVNKRSVDSWQCVTYMYTVLCMLATADMPRNRERDGEQMAGKQMAHNTVFGSRRRGEEGHGENGTGFVTPRVTSQHSGFFGTG